MGSEINSSYFLTFFVILAGMAAVLIHEIREKKKYQKKYHELSEERAPDLLGKGKFSELGLMCAGIAHEISNPLTIVMGNAQLILRNYKKPEKEKEITKRIHQINYQSERIQKIITGLRHYIYRDDEIMEDYIQLSELMDSVLLFCGQRFKNHGIELRLNNLETSFIKGQRGQIEQAVLTLLNNSFDAIDHLKEKWIEISAVTVQTTVCIHFKDSGNGIPEKIKNHMMEPFFTTKETKGTGLGLPLVKSIAEKHGGDLTYDEKEEHTTFILELPRSDFTRIEPKSLS